MDALKRKQCTISGRTRRMIKARRSSCRNKIHHSPQAGCFAQTQMIKFIGRRSQSRAVRPGPLQAAYHHPVARAVNAAHKLEKCFFSTANIGAGNDIQQGMRSIHG